MNSSSFPVTIPASFKVACDSPQACDDGIHGETSTWPESMFTTCDAVPTDPDPGNGGGDPGPVDPPPIPGDGLAKLLEFIVAILQILFGGKSDDEKRKEMAAVNWLEFLQLLLDNLDQVLPLIRLIFELIKSNDTKS